MAAIARKSAPYILFFFKNGPLQGNGVAAVMEQKEDPREKELREVTARAKEIYDLLAAKHTRESVDADIASAEAQVGDNTPVFVAAAGSASFVATRGVQALMQLSDALDVRAKMPSRNLLKEYERLLKRRVALVRELRGV